MTEDDVVLEVGPGRGFLTAFLAQRARLVHAVELDPDVFPALRGAVRDLDNVVVYEADALRFDYGALVPAPNKLVANLPYNVASPLVLRLLEGVWGLDERLRPAAAGLLRRRGAGASKRGTGARGVQGREGARSRRFREPPQAARQQPARRREGECVSRPRFSGLRSGGAGGGALSRGLRGALTEALGGSMTERILLRAFAKVNYALEV